MRGLPCLVSGAILLCGCGGPERAPRQPVPGVDVAHPEDANPHDVTEPISTGPFLGNLVESIVEAYKSEPGVIAVFPGLTPDLDLGIQVVNGLGEHLSETTASRLIDAGVSVLAGSDLVNAIKGASLPLTAYGSTADAISLGETLKATYVVTGTAERKSLDSLQRVDSLDIDWLCRRVADGKVVARYNVRLTGGPLAQELLNYYRLRSQWESQIRRLQASGSGS